jgi:hypothetical protein
MIFYPGKYIAMLNIVATCPPWRIALFYTFSFVVLFLNLLLYYCVAGFYGSLILVFENID